MSKYDFIVLGGGHNGLITTAYMAKAGFNVCVLECNNEFGGGTRSAEVTAPGYISDLGGMVHSMISRTPIVTQDELGLFSKYGFEYIYTDALFGSIFPDNTHLILDADIDKTCQNIAKFSEKDAEAYRKFNKYMSDMLKVAGVASQSPVPKYGAMQNVLSMSPEGREFVRIMNSSAQEVVEEWFETEQVRTTFTRWATEMMINPRTIGTATLLYFTAWAHNSYNGMAPPFPKGGAQELVKALMACCKDNGATLRTNAKVTGIKVANGEAKSVILENGEELFAEKAVISTINVKYIYEMLGDTAPEKERDNVRKLKFSDFAALNQSFALKKIPDFKCGNEIKRVFCIEGAPWEEEYLRIFSDYKFGKFSPNLPLITIPSLWDDTRCPAGHSVVNVYHYAPYNLYGDPQNWVKYKDELQDAVWEFTKSLFTNIKDDDIIGRWGLTPLEYEQWNPAFLHGNIGQIGSQPSQMYDYRPLVGRGHDYHGDIENLYFLGCCSHPGGGIAAGARAGVQKVLDDYGVDFRDVIKK